LLLPPSPGETTCYASDTIHHCIEESCSLSIVAVLRSTVVYKHHGCHPRKRRGPSHDHVSTPLAPNLGGRREESWGTPPNPRQRGDAPLHPCGSAIVIPAKHVLVKTGSGNPERQTASVGVSFPDLTRRQQGAMNHAPTGLLRESGERGSASPTQTGVSAQTWPS
jgi:hypothetical protein